MNFILMSPLFTTFLSLKNLFMFCIMYITLFPLYVVVAIVQDVLMLACWHISYKRNVIVDFA